MATIKNIILFVLTALMMVGCGDYQGKGNFALIGYSDIEIDSCQYIAGYCYRLAHKGNCKFCKERRQKELEELVIKLKEK